MSADRAGAGSDVSISDAAELVLLRGYVAEFRRMLRQYDRTPARWRHYQTQWLWLYLRGMIAAESPLAVKERRLAELEAGQALTVTEEATVLKRGIEASKSRIVSYAKIEMFGGPADGQVVFVSLPIADSRSAHATSVNGRLLKCLYRRPPGEIGDIVSVTVTNADLSITDGELRNAFSGKRATRFVFVQPKRRRAA